MNISMLFVTSFFLATYISALQDTPIAIICNPKTGTNLVAKCLTLMTGRKKVFATPGNNQITLVPEELAALSDKDLFITHAQYLESNRQLVEIYNFKVISILRDPRDQIVSFAHWINKQAAWKHLHHLSIEELITLLITDYNRGYQCIGTPKPTSIDTAYRVLYMPWSKEKYVYTTTFEKLVGPAGGGSKESQITEIMNIAQHLDITLTQKQIEFITDNLFGNTFTFREGLIGSWRKAFTQQHTILFKQVAGQLLIDLGYETDQSW